MINEERLLQSFIKMAETESPSLREGRMRDLLVQEFSRRQLPVIEDRAGRILNGEAGNLLVRVPGTHDAPALLLAAHMDTVEPAAGIKATVEEGTIRSMGPTILGSDDKAAIAALLEVLDVLSEQEQEYPPLELLITVAEEQGLQGSRLFDYKQLQAGRGYVLDAGGPPGTIVIQSPCQNEIEYTVRGKAAHAGMNPEAGINAIQVAAAALALMPCGRIDEETTCNFGLIEGGVARNIVAPECRVKGEARSLKREKLNDLTARLETMFRSQVESKGAEAEVEIKFLYPEMQLDPGEEVVQMAVRAAEKIGLEARMESSGGGSDASNINGAGIRCANLGTGMSAVHTCDEYILVRDLINLTRLILAIVTEAASSGVH